MTDQALQYRPLQHLASRPIAEAASRTWHPWAALRRVLTGAGLALATVVTPAAMAGGQFEAAPDTEPLDLSLAIESSVVTGHFLLDGAAYNPSDGSSFGLNLVNPDDTDDDLLLGQFYNTDFSVAVVSGRYAPAYFYQYGDSAPRNNGQTLEPSLDAFEDLTQDIDVPAVDITPVFVLNGRRFPDAPDEVAEFLLVPEGPGEPILLGVSNERPSAVTVLPGHYAVVYAYQSGTAIPLNEHAVIIADVALTASRRLVIPVRAAQVDATVTLNGTPFPNDAYNYGRIALANDDTGDELTLGDTFGGTLPTSWVIEGRYDAHYRVRYSTGVAPLTPDAIVARDVDISRRMGSLSIDVPSIDLSAEVLVNGAAPPVSAYDYARIGLRFKGTDEVLTLGDTFELQFATLPIVAGTYEAIYSHREGSTLPANVNAVFGDELKLDSSGPVTLDIPSIRMSLNLTLDGQAFPLSAYNYARIDAVSEPETGPAGEPILAGETLEAAQTLVLLAGRYSFFYTCRECQGQVPANAHARFLEGQDLTSSTSLQHDFQSREVRLDATLNGAPFPTDGTVDAELYLGQNAEDRVSFGLTSQLPSAPILLLTGEYEATYAARATGDRLTVPVNRNAVVDVLAIK